MPDTPLVRFTETVRVSDWDSLFPALDALCAEMVGHMLFSCSAFNLRADGGGSAARVYTSDEANYPTSGLKEIAPNRWTACVIDKHETFVANTITEIAEVFPDHALIASMGLGSVVNLPVLRKGAFLGTVNMLHETGYYTGDRLAALDALVLPALLSFEAAR